MNRIRVVAILEGRVVTGPAKNLLKFGVDCRDRVDLTLVTFHRVSAQNGNSWLNSQLISEARRLKIPIEVISETNPLDLKTVSSLNGIVRRHEAQIVETHGTKSHFLVSLLGKRPFSWIAFHHGYTAENVKVKFYQQFDRWSLRRCDSAVTVCEEFAALLARRGVPRDRIHIVHNAVEINPDDLRRGSVQEARRLWKVNGNERIVLSVGRLSPEKGHAYLVEAVSSIVSRCPDWKLRVIIAGSGTCEKRLKEHVETLGLGEHIELVGHRPEMQSLFSIADVFVLPSLSEGSPNVLLESMAAGVPIVATRVGGVPELLKDSESAILVNPADKGSLGEAILELLTNRPLANRLAAVALENVRTNFSPARRNEVLLGIYDHASSLGRSN